MIYVQDTSYTWDWPIKDAKGKTRAAVPKRTHATRVRVIATQTTSAKDTLSQKSLKLFFVIISIFKHGIVVLNRILDGYTIFCDTVW